MCLKAILSCDQFHHVNSDNLYVITRTVIKTINLFSLSNYIYTERKSLKCVIYTPMSFRSDSKCLC